MNSSFNKLLTFKTVITASMIIVFSINLLLIERVDALSDSRQLVLDAWTLVNEGFYDPEKFDEIQWKRIRQKTLQKQIETSERQLRLLTHIGGNLGIVRQFKER